MTRAQIRYILSTLGKDRGYTQRHELSMTPREIARELSEELGDPLDVIPGACRGRGGAAPLSTRRDGGASLAGGAALDTPLSPKTSRLLRESLKAAFVLPRVEELAPLPLRHRSPRLGARQVLRSSIPPRAASPSPPTPFQEAILGDTSTRRLILKARQIGMSQALAIEAIHTCIFQPGATVLFVSRNREVAINLLGDRYDAIAGILDEIPELIIHNRTELGLANGSRIRSLPANRTLGRGFPATRVYLDEYAFQVYAAEIYRSVAPHLSHGGTHDHPLFPGWSGEQVLPDVGRDRGAGRLAQASRPVVVLPCLQCGSLGVPSGSRGAAP